MRIVDRYITRSIFMIFASTVLIFCFLYILIDATSNLDDYLQRQVPLIVLVHYYISFLPIIFVQTSWMACMLAAMLTFSRLNNNNEIIALRSSGMNFWQIAKPALAFGLVISAFLFCVNEIFVPESTAMSKQIRNESIILKADSERKKHAKIKNLTFYGLQNRLFFIDTFDPSTDQLTGITILGQDSSQNLTEKIVALSGKWTGINWKFFQCQISYFNPGDLNNPIDVKYYPEKLMGIKEDPQDFLRQRLNVNSMNIRQLNEYISKFSGSGAVRALNNLKVDLNSKIALPVGTIVILLVGLPLVMTTNRRKGVTFISIGIALAIGFLYHTTNSVGLALGKGGLFPPFLAAWLQPTRHEKRLASARYLSH